MGRSLVVSLTFRPLVGAVHLCWFLWGRCGGCLVLIIIIIIIIILFSFDKISVSYFDTIHIACSATLCVNLMCYNTYSKYLVERGITMRHGSLSTLVVSYPPTYIYPRHNNFHGFD